jgi:ABC-2 type transport system permease protein
MRKILTIAWREYRAMVATKAFLISILMMPILMFGGLAAMSMLSSIGELKERRILIYGVEENPGLFESLRAAAEQENARKQRTRETPSEATSNPRDDFASGPQELFNLEARTEQLDDAARAEISDQIRRGELYAFVELPPNMVTDNTGAGFKVNFYSQDSSLSEARRWLMQNLNRIVQESRLKLSFSDEQIHQIERARAPIMVAGLSLVERRGEEIQGAEEKSEMLDIFLPMGLMMLMFMVIFMAAQPMLETVLEEKSQRIAEVLLGSVSPTQLMIGKLLGTVAGSLTIFAIYMGGSYFAAQQRGWTEHLPLHLLHWFLLFQIFGVLFFASIFMAVGASVSQLKEAQSLLLPVWMVMMLPIFVWLLIIRDPLGPLAVGMSYFPPSISTTMILRLATNQTIPPLQLFTSLAVLIVSTLVIVVLAGRIFRVGILWQGNVPKFNQLLRWAIRG